MKSIAALRFVPISNATDVCAEVAISEVDVRIDASSAKGTAVALNDDTNRYLFATTLIRYAMSTPSVSPSKSGSIAFNCAALKDTPVSAPPR